MVDDDKPVSKETHEAVVAAMRRDAAHSEVKAARAKAGEASVWATVCEIRERAAEIESQHDPVGALLIAAGVGQLTPEYKALRRAVTLTVRYVVFGRKPDAPDKEVA